MKISENEIKRFFQRANEAKNKGESLTKVFEEFAFKTGRAKGSVRNFYYSSLKRAENDPTFRKKFLSDVELSTNKIIVFDKAESKLLLEKILLGQTFGKSVRRVISEMTQNPQIALRYQNKYRNLLKYNRETVLQIREQIAQKYGKCYDPYQTKNDRETQVSVLKKEINLLFDRIALKLKYENQNLKKQLEESQRENLLLKRLIEDKNQTKEISKKMGAV